MQSLAGFVLPLTDFLSLCISTTECCSIALQIFGVLCSPCYLCFWSIPGSSGWHPCRVLHAHHQDSAELENVAHGHLVRIAQAHHATQQQLLPQHHSRLQLTPWFQPQRCRQQLLPRLEPLKLFQFYRYLQQILLQLRPSRHLTLNQQLCLPPSQQLCLNRQLCPSLHLPPNHHPHPLHRPRPPQSHPTLHPMGHQHLLLSPLQLSPLQLSPLQLSPLQLSPLQLSPLLLSPLQLSPLQHLQLHPLRRHQNPGHQQRQRQSLSHVPIPDLPCPLASQQADPLAGATTVSNQSAVSLIATLTATTADMGMVNRPTVVS
jgi:hypothetical protein